ncbi:hypothetical protein AgCh_031500 [Apium graveolens]
MYSIQAINPGPIDDSLLHLQPKRRSGEVWRLGGGDALRCRRSNPNKDSISLDRRMIPFLQSSGFYGVVRVSALQLDWSLLSALVERWRPEIHTFHLPMGEVTITLQDVVVLLGLPIDGRALIVDDIPDPGDALLDLVASIFGTAPPSTFLNGARTLCSFFSSLTPRILPETASLDEVMHRTRCYIVHLIAGVLFTDTSGGYIHPMYLPFLRDLDSCGEYAWGAAVLAFLYRELCKGCKTDKEEVAGCLLLFQLWAWERLPTLAPIPRDSPLCHSAIFDDQLPGPHGDRWLVSLSFKEMVGRTLSIYRTVLDGLAPSNFIWQPYSTDIIDSLPPYCLVGRHIWRYRGPILCIFIVETHAPDRVARQFGMVQSIPPVLEYTSELHWMTLRGNQLIKWSQKFESFISLWDHRSDTIFHVDLIVDDSTVLGYHDWYMQRTVRFISRTGAFHHYVGDLLRSIVDQTDSVLPGVHQLVVDGCNVFRDFRLYGFDALPVDERRVREMDARQDPGRRPRRSRGRGRGRGADVLDQIVADVLGDDVVGDDVVGDDPMMTNLGDVHIDVTQDISRNPYPSFDLHLTPTPHPSSEQLTPHSRPEQLTSHSPFEQRTIEHHSTDIIPERPRDIYPSFDLHLTPTPTTPPEQPTTHYTHELHTTDHPSTDQPPPVRRPDRPTECSTKDHSIPSFDLDTVVGSSQSSEGSNGRRKFGAKCRRLKRVCKPPRCGTDGEKCARK